MRVETDASRGDEVVGIGYVIRSTATYTGSAYYVGEYTSMEAEHLALVHGLSNALSESSGAVEVYVDCQPLVGKILGEEPLSANWSKRRDATHQLLDGFDYWSLKWIPRDENADANRLAQEAFWRGEEKV